MLSPRDLVFRPDNMVETVPRTHTQNLNAKFDENKLEFQAWLSHYKCVQI